MALIRGNQISGSVTSASYALTASYALNGGSGGGVGFPFTGSARITGSLGVTGSVSTTTQFYHSNSLDSSNRQLIDHSGASSIDWDARVLANFSGNQAINWADSNDVLGITTVPISEELTQRRIDDQLASNELIANGKIITDQTIGVSAQYNGTIVYYDGSNEIWQRLEGSVIINSENPIDNILGIVVDLGRGSILLQGNVTYIIDNTTGFNPVAGFPPVVGTPRGGDPLYLTSGGGYTTPVSLSVDIPEGAVRSIGYILHRVNNGASTNGIISFNPSNDYSRILSGTDIIYQINGKHIYALSSSLAISSSFATTATTSLTSSLALRASGSLTGSLLGTATTASYVLNAISSSFATTASYVATLRAAGSTNYVQYNSGGVLGGSSRFTFDGTTVAIVGGTTLSAGALSATGSLLGTASFASTSSFATSASTSSTIITTGSNVGATFFLTFVDSNNTSGAQAEILYTAANPNGDRPITVNPLNGQISASFVGGLTGNVQGTSSFATTAALALRASGSLTGSLLGTASFASTASFIQTAQTASYILNAVSSSFATYADTAGNGGVTQISAGSNISISPTNGKGNVTISATGGGSNYNTATGSYGSFYDTGSYTITSATAIYSMSFSNTSITNGVYISGSDKTRIYFTNPGVYDLQFSAQFVNAATDNADVDIWFTQGNGTGSALNIADSDSQVTVPPKKGSVDGKVIAAWNLFISANANDYVQLAYAGATSITLTTFPANLTLPHPLVPCVIATATRVDTFLSNTGSFSGSFTGQLIGTASYAQTAQTASYALNAVSSSYVNSIERGITTINFGATPGSNYATTTISTPNVTNNSNIHIYIMSTASADHNTMEHQIFSLYGTVVPDNIVDNTSFDIVALTDLRLSGTFKVRYTINNN